MVQLYKFTKKFLREFYVFIMTFCFPKKYIYFVYLQVNLIDDGKLPLPISHSLVIHLIA